MTPELQQESRDAAQRYSLDPSLVCAIVEQESGWDTWAVRYEPAFYERYIRPKVMRAEIKNPTEAHCRAMSWGLMQVMGQTAAEAGFAGKFYSQLCDPIIGLAFGCRIFRKYLDQLNGNIHDALQRWNGGGNPDYANEVIARISHYQG